MLHLFTPSVLLHRKELLGFSAGRFRCSRCAGWLFRGLLRFDAARCDSCSHSGCCRRHHSGRCGRGSRWLH